MQLYRCGGTVIRALLGLMVIAAVPWTSLAEVEHHFSVLQIGTQAYSNVTVTTCAKDYVFVHHSKGMTNIKVAELPPEIRETLGYASQKPKNNTNAWTSQALTKLQSPQVKDLAALLPVTAEPGQGITLDPKWLWGLGVFMLLFYFFWSYCAMLICKKVGNPGSPLIWVPVLQLIPLLRAAKMSGWWFVLFLVPFGNLVAQIVWSVKIVQARGKGILCMISLLLPVTNLFAFMYLAFSSGTPIRRSKQRPVEIMTLEIA